MPALKIQVMAMPKPNKKYLQIERTRHGRVVYYYRIGANRRVRLPDNYGQPSFWEAYDHAASGDIIACARKKKDVSEAICKQAIERALAKSIDGAKQRSRSRGRQFDITLDWLISEVERSKFKCAATGIQFSSSHKTASTRNPFAPSIDRIDSRKGYTKGNVRVVIFALNVMLFDWGEDVFERVANCYRRNKKRTIKARILNPSARTEDYTGDKSKA